MRCRTWVLVWDALGYLVWGYGWPVRNPAENLPNVQGLHLGVDQGRVEPLAALRHSSRHPIRARIRSGDPPGKANRDRKPASIAPKVHVVHL